MRYDTGQARKTNIYWDYAKKKGKKRKFYKYFHLRATPHATPALMAGAPVVGRYPGPLKYISGSDRGSMSRKVCLSVFKQYSSSHYTVLEQYLNGLQAVFKQTLNSLKDL